MGVPRVIPLRITFHCQIPTSSVSDKKSNETKGRDSFKMLTEMIVHICFTASNMLPDDVESTNTDALMEVALLRDTSEQFGKILLKWTENNKREYMDELKCESLIKMISSQINKPICDSSKLSLKNRLTQLTESTTQKTKYEFPTS
uniref:Uncharacterized protein n=1 Tax=Rhizophagus irregularis (strain DAOM 181602 / DAOM 197198 / MUCL 43194) TaxID=747089 RepID=U9SUG1_RHIID